MSRAAGGGDLHLHTIYSDGSHTAAQLVAGARGAHLGLIAVTDHDTVEGVAPTRRAAGDEGPEVVAGVEFGSATVENAGDEIHIVGLFVDAACAELLACLEEYRRRRRERTLRMVEKLNRANIRLRPERVFELSGRGNTSRLHVAMAMVESGYVHSVGAAFSQWLGRGRAGFTPRERPPIADTIGLIHRAGGVAVLAHPVKTGIRGDISRLIEAGLDAVEVYCPDQPAADERRSLEMAQRWGLLVSAGSDCHGKDKDRCTLGKIRLSMEEVEALRERAATYRENREHA